MDLKKYQEFCETIAKKYENKTEEIYNWGLGVAGEAGDVASCIKKTYSHQNDQTKGIRENLGDTMWYIAAICNFYGWDLGEVLQENVDKLSKRFPKGFTFEGAQRKGKMIDWNEKS
ncbi:MAG: nucleoside triphosphate pyrophosphohydrolase family protein [archaeon]